MLLPLFASSAPITPPTPELPAIRMNGRLDFLGVDCFWSRSEIYESLVLVEDDGVTPIVGMSGYDLIGAVRSVQRTTLGAVALDLTPYLSWSTIDGADALELRVLSANNALAPGQYEYDILCVDPATTSAIPFLYGEILVRQRVTP